MNFNISTFIKGGGLREKTQKALTKYTEVNNAVLTPKMSHLFKTDKLKFIQSLGHLPL